MSQSARKKKDKFIQLFGYDEEGNEVERDLRMAPRFYRIQENIPTTTNHSEGFHGCLNQKINLHCSIAHKLATIVDCIDKSIQNFDTKLIRQINEIIISNKKKKVNNILTKH